MKKTLYLLLAAGSLSLGGCAFLGGAAVGATGAGAAYEINNKRQMDRLDADYNSGRITREEYEDRKRQIQKGSILY